MPCSEELSRCVLGIFMNWLHSVRKGVDPKPLLHPPHTPPSPRLRKEESAVSLDWERRMESRPDFSVSASLLMHVYASIS